MQEQVISSFSNISYARATSKVAFAGEGMKKGGRKIDLLGEADKCRGGCGVYGHKGG